MLDKYVDDRPVVEPPRKEYHAAQEGLAEASGKGTPVGGTDSPRVTVVTKQGAYPIAGKGGRKWPSDVDSYTDGEV